jgi:regulator of protease activity HflC (stomatin/prohibitin superfamily)
MSNTDFDFSLPKLRLIGYKFWVGLAVALAVILIILDGLVSVPAGHVGVIFDRGRGVLHTELPEGLHLKIPFWQISQIFDTRLTTINFSSINNSQVQSLTKDGQSVGLDITVQYRIPKAKASEIFQDVGTDYVEKVILPESRKVIRDEITAFDSTDLFAEGKRKESSDKMSEVLREEYADNDIELISVVLRDVTFSPAYLNSIEEKQIAQQRIQTANNDLERIKVEAEQKITAAKAEAESIRVKGEQLRVNPEVIQFEFVDKIAPGISWGILPDSVLPILDLKQLQN